MHTYSNKIKKKLILSLSLFIIFFLKHLNIKNHSHSLTKHATSNQPLPKPPYTTLSSSMVNGKSSNSHWRERKKKWPTFKPTNLSHLTTMSCTTSFSIRRKSWSTTRDHPCSSQTLVAYAMTCEQQLLSFYLWDKHVVMVPTRFQQFWQPLTPPLKVNF